MSSRESQCKAGGVRGPDCQTLDVDIEDFIVIGTHLLMLQVGTFLQHVMSRMTAAWGRSNDLHALPIQTCHCHLLLLTGQLSSAVSLVGFKYPSQELRMVCIMQYIHDSRPRVLHHLLLLQLLNLPVVRSII